MSLSQTLEQAERFIAGFEDDATQEGVEQLLAQLRKASKAHLRRHTSGQITLLPLPAQSSAYFVDEHAAYWIHGTDTFPTPVSMYQRRAHEALNHRGERLYRDAHWYGTEKRLDTQGRIWEASHCMVVDNFGNPVEVPA